MARLTKKNPSGEGYHPVRAYRVGANRREIYQEIVNRLGALEDVIEEQAVGEYAPLPFENDDDDEVI